MSSIHEDIESSLVARLGAKLGSYADVAPMPEDEAEFVKIIQKPKVYVTYSQSDYDKPQSTGFISQHENVQMYFMLLARKLRGANSILELAQKVRLAVLGFDPTHCSKMYLLKLEFQKKDPGGVIIYSLLAECKTIVVEEEVPDADPLIKEITLDNPPTLV